MEQKKELALAMLRDCVRWYPNAKKVIDRIESDTLVTGDFLDQVITLIKHIYEERREVFIEFESKKVCAQISEQLEAVKMLRKSCFNQ